MNVISEIRQIPVEDHGNPLNHAFAVDSTGRVIAGVDAEKLSQAGIATAGDAARNEDAVRGLLDVGSGSSFGSTGTLRNNWPEGLRPSRFP
jgi:hypothetical protein